MLQPNATRAWTVAVPWFAVVSARLAAQTVDVSFLSQAYAELLQISCQHDASMVQWFSQTGDAAAVQHFNELASRDPGSRVDLSTALPGTLRGDGHVPNQLQDLLLQMFGGLRVASDLESAVTQFRNTGSWPESLPSLVEAVVEEPPLINDVVPLSGPGARRSVEEERHALAVAARLRTSSEPPAGVHASDSSQPVETNAGETVRNEALHEHACVRQFAARFGQLRRCGVCANRISRGAAFFRCARGCRFASCASCFSPEMPGNSAENAPNADGNEQTNVPTAPSSNDHPAPQLTRFTRYLCLPRDEFVQRVRTLIDQNRFCQIGWPSLRVEGSTSWGVWLRIFDPTAGARRGNPRVRCGVLYHVSQMTAYFHGDEQATREIVLPLFQDWTFDSLDQVPQRAVGAPFIAPPVLESAGLPLIEHSGSDQTISTGPVVEENDVGPQNSEPPRVASVQQAGMRPADVARENNPPHPVGLAGAAGSTVLTSEAVPDWAMLPQLISQLVQHQAQMQQVLLDILDRLNRGSAPDAQQRPCCSHASCADAADSGCVAQMCAQHCSSSECAIHCSHDGSPCGQTGQRHVSNDCHAELTHSPAYGDRRRSSHATAHIAQADTVVDTVCRRPRCRNLVASTCHTGYCRSHCLSRRCSCRRQISAERPEAHVCRRPGCTAQILPSCRTGYCPTHCTSVRCTCQARCHSPSRRCRNLDCRRSVASSCRTGYCATHCRSRACPCHMTDPPPTPPRPLRRRNTVPQTCRRASCHNVVEAACATGFCRSHCTSSRCGACNREPRNAPHSVQHDGHEQIALCRRRGCRNRVAVNCSTGYCPEHCLSPRCCAGEAANHLPDYLREACPDLQRNSFDDIPAPVRETASSLRALTQCQGNVRGSRRHRQRGGDRTM